ncbi:thiol-disulfide oxidoreductase DCC family protein [Haloferula sp.]|uniref:thiol-disulfide oxidoreductase DCC family protein n=1 Tax=Haloferula sp. TaxID=2497595 RepID=UPI003C75658C
MDSDAADPIVIAFDGECLMCSRTIRWLANRDSADRIRFTRLQDPTGAEMAAQSGGKPLDSMLVRRNGEILARSTAVLVVLETLGGRWRIPVFLGKAVPLFLRDAVYNFIADHRYHWFGKGDACALPSEALHRRLIP